MKFYIIDDDMAVIRILENIIENKNLGEVIGYSTDGIKGAKEIILRKPDIALVDLIMPEIDGMKLVREVKENFDSIKFIMISQVTTKSMISKAYKSGIEFFINKPINIIEVANVIRKVSEKTKMEKTLSNIKSMFEYSNFHEQKNKNKPFDEIKKIKIMLSKLGILGEKGGEDILKICDYLLKLDQTTINYKIKDICSMLSDNSKAMEQRIRRAINKSLVNLANIGLEDYMNENFIRYSNSLFDFEDVKAEMDYIRGKRSTGGKISSKKFIDNLLLYSEI